MQQSKKLVNLSLTTSYLLESDPSNEAKPLLSIHEIQSIQSILLYPDDPERFSIEYKNDKTYTYVTDNRDFHILNIMDAFERKLGMELMITIQENFGGVREGSKGFFPNEDYQDLLFKKMNSIEKIDSQTEVLKLVLLKFVHLRGGGPRKRLTHIKTYTSLLAEFVTSFSFKYCPYKEKGIVKILARMLNKIIQPGIGSREMMKKQAILILQALEILVYTKAGYEEIASIKDTIRSVVLLLYSTESERCSHANKKNGGKKSNPPPIIHSQYDPITNNIFINLN